MEFGKDDYTKLITANNELGFELLSEVEDDENNNIFISPTSIFMALSMVYNGADGETKDEIEKTMHIEGMKADELKQSECFIAHGA